MQYSLTTATRKIAKLTKKIRAVQGGTSASKTISILLYLIHMAQADKDKTLTSVVSESIPHLKRGAIRDFKNIMQSHNLWNDKLWNATDSIYSFETGSQIEFFSSDQPDKLRGARRDRLFINEANNINLDAFDQLEVRTKEFVFLDWNPSNEFWFYEEIKGKREDLDFIILTYKDNEALSPEIIASIESRKERKGWWRVYGEGQLGEVEGKIYKDWQIIDEVPHEARLERYGLDYGYTNDPTSIVAVYKYNNSFILDEITYQKGLSNKQIADILSNQPQALVVADSAEPKSNDELLLHGVNVLPANKGQGSVNQGIQLVQDQRISVTKRSVNVIKEYRNYLWETDKSGRILNVPEHTFSHSMDACFIAGTKVLTKNGEKNIEDITTDDFVVTRKGLKRVLSSGLTGKNKKIYELTTKEGKKLSGTKNHKVLVNSEWISLCDIRYGDILLTWKPQGTIKERITTYTQKLNNFIVENISITGKSFFTVKYIKMFMEKFLKECMSIIKTETHTTIAQRTLSYSQIPNMVNYTGKQSYLLLKTATNVNQNSKTITGGKKIDSVRTNAKANGEGIVGLIHKLGNVFSAKPSLLLTNMLKLSIVPVLAQTVQETNQIANVYNLEVEEIPEYFANGVLVHNCRYAMETLNIDQGLSDLDKYMLGEARRNGTKNFSR